LRLDPDPPTQTLNNLLAHGQSDSGAGELVLSVQALEKDEDLFKVSRVDPESIVSYGKNPVIATGLRGGEVHVGDFGTSVLDCVPDEILKYLGQLRVVRPDGWQRIVSHHRTTFLNRCS
jgi:hypothetical protein